MICLAKQPDIMQISCKYDQVIRDIITKAEPCNVSRDAKPNFTLNAVVALFFTPSHLIKVILTVLWPSGQSHATSSPKRTDSAFEVYCQDVSSQRTTQTPLDPNMCLYRGLRETKVQGLHISKLRQLWARRPKVHQNLLRFPAVLYQMPIKGASSQKCEIGVLTWWIIQGGGGDTIVLLTLGWCSSYTGEIDTKEYLRS